MSYALITGASSGIGYELTQLFARNGNNLVLVSRRKDILQKMADDLKTQYNIEVLVMPVDLGLPGAADDIHNKLIEKSITIKYLVNNAGCLVKGEFKSTSREEEQRLIQMQCITYTELSKLLLPSMLSKNSGGILNVGSTGSFVPGPYSAIYCAAKSFVLSFTEALAEEVKGTGVHITALCPGGTNTPFHNDSTAKRSVFLSMMEPSKVAEIGYKAFMKGKRLAIPGFSNRLQIFFTRFVPRRLIVKTSGNILAKQHK
ncbi:MAG: SDR family oxidoreductase [Bacteroidales bacterium]|nr:SDR family oxidoreductase [Bacteroidales bacterium]